MDALRLRLSNYKVTKDDQINNKKIFHYANKKVIKVLVSVLLDVLLPLRVKLLNYHWLKRKVNNISTS